MSGEVGGSQLSVKQSSKILAGSNPASCTKKLIQKKYKHITYIPIWLENSNMGA